MPSTARDRWRQIIRGLRVLLMIWGFVWLVEHLLRFVWDGMSPFWNPERGSP